MAQQIRYDFYLPTGTVKAPASDTEHKDHVRLLVLYDALSSLRFP